MTVPDPDLQFDEASGHYRFGEIDWQEFNEVISGRGICNHERLAPSVRPGKRANGCAKPRWPMRKNSRPAARHEERQHEQSLLAVI
ncbi:Phenylacetic acid degradation protein paaA [Serratia liquefaciens]|nr:Phenylacetic acid degradation protein paaA [Serratia liquefaciens]